MVDKTGIFNNASLSVGLRNQELQMLRRQLGHANWNKIL